MAGRSRTRQRGTSRAPMADELEVTVLGCGYGESIVVHRGENDWFVIDSFIHKTTRDGGVVERTSAALAYLKSIDVGPARVGEVFLSHYHEDHAAGFQFLAEATDATFHWPPLLNRHGTGAERRPDRLLVEAVLDQLIEVDERRRRAGVSQLRDAKVALNQRRADIASKFWVHPSKPPIKGVLEVLAPVATYLNHEFPGLTKPTRKAEKNRNLSSLVLQLTVDDVSMIFGADLENDVQLGWAAVRDELDDRAKGGDRRPPASLVKIPHHGSRGAVHPRFYDLLVDPSAIAILTTQDHGTTSLPNDDAARLAPRQVARVVNVESPPPRRGELARSAQWRPSP